VPGLRRAATTFASTYCDHDTLQTVALAVTEACSNVVRHAYPEGQGGLTLTARLDGDCLIFEIADQGTGLTGSGRRDDGLGMGLMLMRRLAAAHITSDRHGTRVELRFPRCSPP
jgi:two-component sensor histidine kinase